MTRSLQRHLSLVLGSAVLISALVAALASFLLAYSEAKEFQDDMLRQVAVLNGNVAQGGARSGEGVGGDPESRIQILHLPGSPLPAWLTSDLKVGFHTLDTASGRLRVYIHDNAAGARTVLAQLTDARDEIAVNSALRTLIPLLLLLPLLAWLVVRIVRQEFMPVTRLSARLDAQATQRPLPLADDGLPDEIRPFVQAINRLLERVNLLVAQQTRFIADAAHELRSPLTALSVQAQNLDRATSLADMQARAAPLQAGIVRAQRLTDQLLNLARIQTGGAVEAEVDVPALARALIAEFLPRAKAGGIDLGLDEKARFSLPATEESLRLILANALANALDNALDNALKYTPTGGEVTLRLLTAGDDYLIEVVNTGPGIPEDERDRVFDAFYRPPGAVGSGSGLGLAIAREAAMRLGGSIELLTRQDGSGLVFSYRQKRPA